MDELIEIPNQVWTPKSSGHGKQAFICRDQPLLSRVCEKYGRNPENMAIKIFHGNPLKEGETLEDALWGDNHNPNDNNQVRKNTKLLNGTRVQNMLWWEKKAARVYAVFEGLYQGQRVACQLTEYLEGPNPKDQSEVYNLNLELVRLGQWYKFSHIKNVMSTADFIGGKCVDLQEFELDPDHEEKIREIYFDSGRYGKIYYQDVPELGLQGGPRKSLDRVKYLGLENIDFTGKVVWDVGCAGGFFCRYAESRGAKRVIGFDGEKPIYAAFMLSNYLKYFNIDYEVLDLRNGIPDKYPKPDIVFYLSMNFHIPTPQRIFEAQKIIFEDNGKESRAFEKPTEEFTKQHSFNFIGRGVDHGDKAIYHLTKHGTN